MWSCSRVHHLWVFSSYTFVERMVLDFLSCSKGPRNILKKKIPEPKYALSAFEFMLTEKKKRCIAKLFITQKICSRWGRKFINIVSLIQSFNYQTFTSFHVRLVRHLYFLWKLLFMSSASGKQHATTLNDAKLKFMQLMMRKPLYFC